MADLDFYLDLSAYGAKTSKLCGNIRKYLYSKDTIWIQYIHAIDLGNVTLICPKKPNNKNDLLSDYSSVNKYKGNYVTRNNYIVMLAEVPIDLHCFFLVKNIIII